MLHIVFLLCLSASFIILICVVGDTMTLMWRLQLTDVGSLSTMQVPEGPNSAIRPDRTFSPEQSHLLERSFSVQLFTLFLSNRWGKKAIRCFYPCPLAHWTPLPRGSQSTSVLSVCQSSPCLSTLVFSLCPCTCAFVTQLCICTNFIHSTPCSVHHSFCVVPLGATYVLCKVISTSK